MKDIQNVKVDLVNSKWLSFNEIDITKDPMFAMLSDVLKPDEDVYSVILGNIILTDKKMAKKAKKLSKLEMKIAKGKKPVTEEQDAKMEELSAELADPKDLGKAIIVITQSRIITIYEDLNKMYKLKKLVKDVNDITEIDAKKDPEKQNVFSFSIAFGRKKIKLVTNDDKNIRHFEFTLDELIKKAAEEEITKNL